MRLATARIDGAARWGIIEDERFLVAPGAPASADTLLAFVEAGGARPDPRDWRAVPLDGVELLAPFPQPRRNVMCLGLNYADHAAEAQGTTPEQAEPPEYPVVFTKATTTVTGPRSDVPLDPRTTRRLDWEVELAVVIGRGGRFIAEADAPAHILGYTIVNDLSARDLQKRHRQFFLGKSMDGSCPMGPWITTRDAVPDPHALAIRSAVNGVTKQESSTRHLLFGVPRIIEQLSNVMTLLPGDVIATGTPSGVGFARTPAEYLQAGDVVECEIEGLGRLRNRITGAGP